MTRGGAPIPHFLLVPFSYIRSVVRVFFFGWMVYGGMFGFVSDVIDGFKIAASRRTSAMPHVGSERLRVIGAARSGIRVDERSALALSTVWRCVNLISGSLMTLPWSIRARRSDDGSDRVDDHPASRLLWGNVNDEMTSDTFRRTVQAWAVTWGNGYAEIEQTRMKAPHALWPISPDRVEEKRDSRLKIIYDVNNGSSPNTVIPIKRMLHTKGLGFDGLKGYSVVAMAQRAIELGLSTESFGLSHFGNGTLRVACSRLTMLWTMSISGTDYESEPL